MDTDNVTPLDGQEKDKTPIIDKMMQNNPFFKMGQESVQNIQTQSMVKSSREEADERLAAIDAYNAEALRKQKLAEDAAKAKRTAIYIALGVFFAAIFVALVWLAINAVIAMTKPVSSSDETGQQGGNEVVEEKCTPDTCDVLVKVSSTLALLKGKEKIYLYDSTKTRQKATLTTIPQQAYHAITPFVWGKDTFVVLDPESNRSALYNVTKNRQITEFNYDGFFYDVKNAIYNDMTWVVNEYIVATADGDRRLIDLSSGDEILRATAKVFVRDGYFFGKENDGMVHVYLSKDRKLGAFEAGTRIYLKEKNLILISPTNRLQIFNLEGKLDTQSDVGKEVTKINTMKRVETLDADASFYKVNL